MLWLETGDRRQTSRTCVSFASGVCVAVAAAAADPPRFPRGSGDRQGHGGRCIAREMAENTRIGTALHCTALHSKAAKRSCFQNSKFKIQHAIEDFGDVRLSHRHIGGWRGPQRVVGRTTLQYMTIHGGPT